jgi:hypothetical protein
MGLIFIISSSFIFLPTVNFFFKLLFAKKIICKIYFNKRRIFWNTFSLRAGLNIGDLVNKIFLLLILY